MATRRSGSGATAESRGASSGAAGGSSSSSQSAATVAFCANPILFENCGQLLDAPSGLTTASIMTLRRESGNTTSISLAQWKDLAYNVLGLKEAAAYSIFDVFYALSGGCIQGTPSYAYGAGGSDRGLGGKTVAEYRLESNRALLAKMKGTVDESRWPVASTARQVSLPGLTIFLLVQLLLERPPRQPLGEISPELVVNNLRQYLHDYIIAVAATRQGRVTVADALELRILLREFVGGVEVPLGTSLGTLWPRSESTIDIAILSQFIRPRIVQPSELYRRLPRPAGSPSAQQTNNPPRSFPNNVTVRGCRDRVVVPPPPPPAHDPHAAKLMSSNYTIADCSHASIYVASALPHTRLTKLTNCTVALGPVAGVLTIDQCENCTISALCGCIIVTASSHLRIFVCTNTPPVLLHQRVLPQSASQGQNSSDEPVDSAKKDLWLWEVRFAPYNSHYSTLEEDLELSGISPKLNLWNAGLPSQDYIIPPEEFTPISFPVQPQVGTSMTTRTNPCPLPRPYQDALSRRLKRFEEISNDLHDAYRTLEDEGRRDLADRLRNNVHAMFMQWLQQNGQSTGLSELLQVGPASGK